MPPLTFEPEAILARPHDADRKTKAGPCLVDTHISVIWFPEEKQELIDPVLELLDT